MPSIITIGVLAFASTALAHQSYTLHAYEGVDYFPTPISGGQPPLDTSPPLHPTGTFYYTPTGSGGYTPTGGPSSSSSSSVTAPYGNHTTTFTPSTTSSPPTTTPYLPTTSPDVILTTKTAYTTIVSTITSCPPVVTKCPVGDVVTKTIAVSTYICPVSEAGPTVTLVPIPESEYTQHPTPEYPSTNEPTYPDSPSTEEPYTPPHVPATSTPVAPYPYPTSFTTLTGAPSGTAPVGSGTGVIHPTSPPYVPGTIEVTPITPPQSEQTTPPILEHTGAAGKRGVSSVLALVVVGVVALIF